MAQFDLTADAWTEVIAAGGSSDQMIVLGMGEALISLGAPGAATSAIKMGGASRASLLDGRIFIAPAGTAVWMRPVGGRVIFSTGATAGGAPTPTPTPMPTFTQLGTATVTETSASALTNYQVPVVDPTSKVFAWKTGMNANFSNLVFKDQDGTVLVPSITADTIVPGVSCVPYIKMPALASGEVRNIIYGSTTDTLPSSTTRGENVFIFFDDFEAGFNSAKWDTAIVGTAGGERAWAGYTDEWRITGDIFTGKAFDQGVCANGTYVWGGEDTGGDTLGPIRKYDYAGNVVGGFATTGGTAHNNGLFYRAAKNTVITNSAGANTLTVIQEINGDTGAIVNAWTNSPVNGAYFGEITGGFRYLLGASGQILNLMDDGSKTVAAQSYTIDRTMIPAGVRSQNYCVVGDVLHYLVNDTIDGGSSYSVNDYSTVYRWKLNSDYTTTPLAPWRHFPGDEVESITHDGTDFLISQHTGSIQRVVINNSRVGMTNTAAVSGYLAQTMGKQLISGDHKARLRICARGYQPRFGMQDVLTSPQVGYYMQRVSAGDTSYARTVRTAGTNTSTSPIAAANDIFNFHNYEFTRRGTAMNIVRDGVTIGTQATVTTDPLAPIFAINNQTTPAGGYTGADYIAVSKFATTEPTVTVT